MLGPQTPGLGDGTLFGGPWGAPEGFRQERDMIKAVFFVVFLFIFIFGCLGSSLLRTDFL